MEYNYHTYVSVKQFMNDDYTFTCNRKANHIAWTQVSTDVALVEM